MPLDSYTNLKTAIADHLDRSDLTSQIDDFIDVAESVQKRDVRIREMIKRSRATASERYLALPGDYLEMQVFRLLTNPVTVLSQVAHHEMTRVRQEVGGKPKFFSVHEEIEFDVVPEEAYSAEMIYYASLPALSNAQETNGLLTRAPDIYLYGSLVAAEPFLGNDERISTWKTFYDQAIASLNRADKKSRHRGPLNSRIQGARP